MKIQYHKKGITLTNRITQQFEDKLSVLKKYKGALKVLHIQVEISRDQHHKKGDVYRVEINVDLPQKVLRSAQIAPDILSALDMVTEKLERQARDAKDMSVTRKKQAG